LHIFNEIDAVSIQPLVCENFVLCQLQTTVLKQQDDFAVKLCFMIKILEK